MVCILFFFILAVTGVQNFSGGMNSCNDPNVEGPTMFDCVGYYSNATDEVKQSIQLYWTPKGALCEVLPTPDMIDICYRNGTGGCETCFDGHGFPRLWEPTPYNFDNVGAALLVVFEVSSGEMWPDIMYSTMDITGPDQPMREWPHLEGKSVAIWYIAVTLVCSFLMLNVFVGVIIDNFNQMKEMQNGSGLLTEEQKLWVETMKLSMNQKPIKKLLPPNDPNRKKLWNMVMSKRFEAIIMCVIMLNTLVMCLSYAGQSPSYEHVLSQFNFVFLIIFTIEAILKLIALDIQYFKEIWNWFDFVLVVLGYVGLVGGLGPLASLLRIFRIVRIFRLVRTSQGLLNLFRTLIYSIPSIWNVGAILILLMLIFAIMGMNLFANIKHGELLNENANFETFWGSMNTLFRMATGESFNGIMHDCMIQPPYCSEEYGNCGYPQFAPMFFCLYFVFSAYMLLSMITAIILDNFGDTQAMSHNTVTEEHLDAFKEAWADLDPKGSMFLDEKLLPKLIQKVPHPLGVKNHPNETSSRKYANKLIQKLNVPSIDGKVAFNDVLTELTGHAMPGVEIPEESKILVELNKKKDTKQNKMLKRAGTMRSDLHYNAAHVNGIMVIQSAMRGYIYRRKVESMKQMMVETGVISQETLDANVTKLVLKKTTTNLTVPEAEEMKNDKSEVPTEPPPKPELPSSQENNVENNVDSNLDENICLDDEKTEEIPLNQENDVISETKDDESQENNNQS